MPPPGKAALKESESNQRLTLNIQRCGGHGSSGGSENKLALDEEDIMLWGGNDSSVVPEERFGR